MQNKFTISVFTENKPGLLYRISGLFLKRKINVESLTVSETEKEGISRFTILVHVDQETAHKLARQLERIIEVTHVEVHADDELIAREIVLVRIALKNKQEKEQIQAICKEYWAHILERFSTDTMCVVEIDGSEEKIDECYQKLEQFEITEYIASGRIAITR